jgi:uncharacterized membrane protein YeiH
LRADNREQCEPGGIENKVPAVLRSICMPSPPFCALLAVVGYVLNLPPTTMAISGAALCFGIRLVAIRRGWRLPVAGFSQRSKSDPNISDDEVDQSRRR